MIWHLAATISSTPSRLTVNRGKYGMHFWHHLSGSWNQLSILATKLTTLTTRALLSVLLGIDEILMDHRCSQDRRKSKWSPLWLKEVCWGARSTKGFPMASKECLLRKTNETREWDCQLLDTAVTERVWKQRMSLQRTSEMQRLARSAPYDSRKMFGATIRPKNESKKRQAFKVKYTQARNYFIR